VIEKCNQAVELNANNPFGHWMLARCFDAADKTVEVLAEAEESVRLCGNHTLYEGQVGYALARTKDRAGALTVLGELAKRQNSVDVSAGARVGRRFFQIIRSPCSAARDLLHRISTIATLLTPLQAK